MISTDKIACNILADLLVAHGVEHVVLSPGSRNAPLIMAMARRRELHTHVVVDERSAAFMALGLSNQTGRPVAMVCTSGTALLNYAPAVAEAYYRGVPIVAISADRPEEWIDQDDSQTLWQQDALRPYVKRAYDISARLNFDNAEWWVRRAVNDALLEAVSGRKGPVHINVRLDAPLNAEAEYRAASAAPIRTVEMPVELPAIEMLHLADQLASPRKVLIVAGFMPPDRRLNETLEALASLPNFAVMTETLSNLKSAKFISRIDATLSAMNSQDKYELQPEVVITIGGALVSRHIKEWLRSLPRLEHWHVGVTHTTVDCFKHLTLKVPIPPTAFMQQLAKAMNNFTAESYYAGFWAKARKKGMNKVKNYLRGLPWSDFKALSMVFGNIPAGWNVHLSNGTPVRYAQLFDCSGLHRCDCNRGVSGIDGCTSTALGASIGYNGVTLLITGDMSFQYDLAAITSELLTPRFKIIVMDNGGGGIFRFISSTRELPELQPYFVTHNHLDTYWLGMAYKIRHFKVENEEQFRMLFPDFIAEDREPAIFVIKTDGVKSARILKEFFQ